MRAISLRWRIAALVTAIAAAAVTVLSAAAYAGIRRVYLGHLDRMLRIMSNAALAELQEAGPAEGLDASLRAITQSPWRGTGVHWRLWREGQDGDLSASAARGGKKAQFLWELPASARPAGQEPSFLDLWEQKKAYRAIWATGDSSVGPVHLAIAHPSSYEQRRFAEFLTTLLIAGAALVAAAAGAGAWMARRAIRPVATVAQRLSQVSHANMDGSDLAGLDAPAELRPFVEAVQALLGRLDSAVQRLQRFTADASHELRTPLSVAQSTLQLGLVGTHSPVEYRQMIAEAVEDLDRMDRLIHQLLALARMDEQPGLPRPEDVPLEELLGELEVTFGAKAAEAGGAVQCAALAPVVVRGDRGLLSLLLGNLLDNAVKYGPPGGTVRVRLERESDAWCVVSVHDEGGSIPPEAIPRLFDRFYRAEPSRSRDSGGSGLGLAIAQGAVARHGGQITVVSSPEAGTTFRVRLPCLLAEAKS